MKLKLQDPVKLGELPEIGDLSFRETVVAGDMRGIAVRSPMNFEDVLKIAGRLTGQTDQVMNGLSYRDMLSVIEMVGGFLEHGPKTVTAPSQS